MRSPFKPAFLLLLLSLAPVAEPLALAHQCGNQSSDTAGGALLGGLLGALVGGKDNRLAGAIIGGAAGALIGNAVGRDVDRADQCDFGYAYNDALEHNSAGYSEDWQGPRGHGRVRIIQTGYAREDHTECRQWGSTYYDGYGNVHEESGYVCRTESRWVERDQVVWADADQSIQSANPYRQAPRDDDYSSVNYADYNDLRNLNQQLRYTYSSRDQMMTVQNFTMAMMSRNQFIHDADREEVLESLNFDVRNEARITLMRISR